MDNVQQPLPPIQKLVVIQFIKKFLAFLEPVQPYLKPVESSQYPTDPFNIILLFVFQLISSIKVFWQKFSMHFLFLPCVLLALPISPFLICSLTGNI
jgi:hypothetical protein